MTSSSALHAHAQMRGAPYRPAPYAGTDGVCAPAHPSMLHHAQATQHLGGHGNLYPHPRQSRMLPPSDAMGSHIYPAIPPPSDHGMPHPYAQHRYYPSTGHVASHPTFHDVHERHDVAYAPSAPRESNVEANRAPSSPGLAHAHSPGASADRSATSYRGHIKTSTDAILLLAACDLPNDASTVASGDGAAPASPPPRRIHRRLLESERAGLIKTGSVFVWDEAEAGMRRWTDGRCWSASRVSGCFLTYRELEMRKRSATDLHGPRANQYKVDGLIKQSFSMTTTSGRKLHIVSYYTKRDLREGRLRRVSEDPRFVGEGGGEWGLEVDEAEFPDPVVVNSEQAASAAIEGGQQHVPRTGVHAHKAGEDVDKSTDAATEPTVTSPQLDVAKPPLPPPSTAMPVKRPRSRGDDAAPISRPPLKRLRSSSAGELLMGRKQPVLPELSVRRQSDQEPELLSLTESHISSAGLRSDIHSRLRQSLARLNGQMGGDMADVDGVNAETPSTDTEQDSAAGVLLSLRSSHGGSFKFTSGGSASASTPLTSPDESAHLTPDEKVASGKAGMKTATVSSPTRLHPHTTTRPPPPERSSSDRDALNKLSVRL